MSSSDLVKNKNKIQYLEYKPIPPKNQPNKQNQQFNSNPRAPRVAAKKCVRIVCEMCEDRRIVWINVWGVCEFYVYKAMWLYRENNIKNILYCRTFISVHYIFQECIIPVIRKYIKLEGSTRCGYIALWV